MSVSFTGLSTRGWCLRWLDECASRSSTLPITSVLTQRLQHHHHYSRHRRCRWMLLASALVWSQNAFCIEKLTLQLTQVVKAPLMATVWFTLFCKTIFHLLNQKLFDFISLLTEHIIQIIEFVSTLNSSFYLTKRSIEVKCFAINNYPFCSVATVLQPSWLSTARSVGADKYHRVGCGSLFSRMLHLIGGVKPTTTSERMHQIHLLSSSSNLPL